MVHSDFNKILIIGGSGFIGRSIRHYYHLTSPKKLVMSISKEDLDLISASSWYKLRQRIDLFNPSLIIVLAAIKRQIGDNADILIFNNMIIKNISQALINYSARIIYFSSCAVYGEKNAQNSISEDQQLAPTSLYGEHKVYAEKYLLEHLDPSNLLILRPPLIYSMHDNNGYHPGGFLAKAMLKGEIALWGDGSEKRELINIFDIPKVLDRLIITNSNGITNLVSGHSYAFCDIARYISKLIGCKIDVKPRNLPKVDHTYQPLKLISTLSDFRFMSPYNAIQTFISI